MQVAMPCVLFAASPSELRLRGGTNAEMAPQIDYTVMVRISFFAFLNLAGAQVTCILLYVPIAALYHQW